MHPPHVVRLVLPYLSGRLPDDGRQPDPEGRALLEVRRVAQLRLVAQPPLPGLLRVCARRRL